ncbi:MAG: hypothetical protein U0T36_07515 [Saprospiraceae bacterium]
MSSATVSNPQPTPSTTPTYTLTATTTATGAVPRANQVIVTVNTTPPTANAGTDFTKTYIQCKWRIDRNDSSPPGGHTHGHQRQD